jgi:excisionase family DNA binding protein
MDDLEGVSVIEAARLLAVARVTIYDWVREGKIGVARSGERKRGRGLRLQEEDVSRLHAERMLELEQKLREAKQDGG